MAKKAFFYIIFLRILQALFDKINQLKKVIRGDILRKFLTVPYDNYYLIRILQKVFLVID